MLWFKKKEPKAVVNIHRQTGVEETATVVVNSYELSSDAIYEALTAAADALQRRVIENNRAALAAEYQRAVDPSKPLPKEFVKQKKLSY